MSYDAWLEAPYQRRAARDEEIERVEEDLWNEDSPVQAAIVLLHEALTPRLSRLFADLVADWAAEIVDDGLERPW